MLAMHDQKADARTDESLPTLEPHHEEAGLRVKAEAGVAAVEGAPVQVAFGDPRSSAYMYAVGVGVALFQGIEQFELAATRIDVEDGLAAWDTCPVCRWLASTVVTESVVRRVGPGIPTASFRVRPAGERNHVGAVALVHM